LFAVHGVAGTSFFTTEDTEGTGGTGGTGESRAEIFLFLCNSVLFGERNLSVNGRSFFTTETQSHRENQEISEGLSSVPSVVKKV
jgi:hypothetical protein